jgi:hypothetical protein
VTAFRLGIFDEDIAGNTECAGQGFGCGKLRAFDRGAIPAFKADQAADRRLITGGLDILGNIDLDIKAGCDLVPGSPSLIWRTAISVGNCLAGSGQGWVDPGFVRQRQCPDLQDRYQI